MAVKPTVILLAVLTVIAVVTFSLSIATLVKVSQHNHDDNSKPAPAPAPAPTQASPNGESTETPPTKKPENPDTEKPGKTDPTKATKGTKGTKGTKATEPTEPTEPTKGTPATRPPGDDDTRKKLHLKRNRVVDEKTEPEKFKAYSSYAMALDDSLNTEIDPCTDFYAYACGKHEKEHAMREVQAENVEILLNAINKDKYKDQPFFQKLQTSFNRCVKGVNDPTVIHNNGASLKKVYEDLRKRDFPEVPVFEAKGAEIKALDEKALAKVLGTLSGEFQINIFLSPTIGTNWKNPVRGIGSQIKPYKLFLDQPTLTLGLPLYQEPQWQMFSKEMKKGLKERVVAVAKALGKITNEDLEKDIDDVIAFEHEIATTVNIRDQDRRDYSNFYNPYDSGRANIEFGFVDFETYTDTLISILAEYIPPKETEEKAEPGMARPSRLTNKDVTEFIVNAPKVYQKLQDLLKTTNARVINNYIFFRLFFGLDKYIPREKEETTLDVYLKEARGFNNQHQFRKQPPVPINKFEGEKDPQRICVYEMMDSFMPATSRIYLDEIFPGETHAPKAEFKEKIAFLVNSVKAGFQAQIDKLDWMTPESKAGAYDKLKYLVTNLAYPNFVLNDAALNKYYDDLDIPEGSTFFEYEFKLRHFVISKHVVLLLEKDKINRENYFTSMAEVNSWHQWEYNAMMIPAGILRKPFFDPNYPAAVNYGSIGYLIGHEVVHAFEDHGVQFDGRGVLRSWMDATSKKQFNKMTQCVIDEYNGFEAAPGLNIDGVNSQGENIGDNAGIIAAYNAFKSHQDYFGIDPQLPDDEYSFYSQDQLFFLSFARTWCESPRKKEQLQKQIWFDPHPPSKWRIFGTLKNFPGFQSAFNCPVGSPYAPKPKERCNVWNSDARSDRGVPNVPTVVPDVQVDPARESNDKGYQIVATRLTDVINVDKKPCDNFYEFSCNAKKDLPTEAEDALRKEVIEAFTKTALPSTNELFQEGRALFTLCKERSKTPVDNEAINKILQQYKPYTEVLPNFNENNQKIPAFDWDKLSNLSAIFSHKYDLNTFFRVSLRPNPKRAFNDAPYTVFIEPPKLTLLPETFTRKEGQGVIAEYEKVLLNLMATLLNSEVTDTIKTNLQYARTVENDLANLLLRNAEEEYEYLSIKETDSKYPNFAITSYLSQIINDLDADIVGVLPAINRRSLKVVISHPKVMNGIHGYLTVLRDNENDRVGILNYIYIQLFYRLQHFITIEKAPQLSQDYIRSQRTPIIPPIVAGASDAEVNTICANQVKALNPLSYAAAGMHAFKTAERFREYQKDVATVVDYVIRAYEAQFEGISWMTSTVKNKALAKLRGIARTIGVPNDLIDILYEKKSAVLEDPPTDTLLTYWERINRKKAAADYKLLMKSGDAERSLYLNHNFEAQLKPVWFNHDTNSFTVSLTAMIPPLFSREYPQFYNFATLGTLVAELISHQFDGVGLQRNEFGQIQDWLDDESSKVIKENEEKLKTIYDNLEESIITPDDILADNAGTQLAFKAFRLFSQQNNEKLQKLPSPLLQKLSKEELFFLTLAQRYCPDGTPTTLDNKNRLQSALANFPTFQNTFNCRVGSNYAWIDRVQIFESKSDGFVGVPVLPQHKPDLNIPVNAQDTSEKYIEVAKEFENSIDTSANPCTDFYKYTCGKYTGNGGFSEGGSAIAVKLITSLKEPISDDEDVSINLAKTFYQGCTKNIDKFNELNQDGAVLKLIVKEFSDYTGIKFPWIDDNEVTTPLTGEQFGKAIGYLSGKEGINVLLRNMIYTNSRNPDKGYSVYFSTAYLKLSYYINKGDTEDQVAEKVQYAILRYIKAVTPDQVDRLTPIILEEAKLFYQIEKLLLEPPPKPFARRDYNKMFPPSTLKEASEKYPQTGINIKSYLEGFASQVAKAQTKVTKDTYDLVMMEEEELLLLLTRLSDINTKLSLKPTTLINYLFYNIMDYDFGAFLPSAVKKDPELLIKDLEWKREIPELPKKPKRHIQYPESKIPIHTTAAAKAAKIDKNDVTCYYEIKGKFEEAINALFTEIMYPNQKARDDTRQKVAKFINSINLGFRSMIDQLTWMTPETKVGAYAKIDLLVKNIGFPEISTDFKKLDEYYSELEFDDATSYPLVVRRIKVFNNKKTISDLALDVFDRTKFGASFDINAWYQPAANSITIPTAILRTPFYDPEWPDSVNFGAIGVVAGHELIHGFDDSGVQWDSVGRLRNWMDKKSAEAFNEMAQCVIDQYKTFCYDDGKCVDGDNTQGENIADNGGIQAAFRAYKAATGFKGPDGQLPSPMVGQFSHDQLFFLSFARVWCKPPQTTEERDEILRDTHSPSQFRVLGTLQNYPAFREAFNCPLKSNYAPEQHCKVWIEDVQNSLVNPTPLPPKA